MSKVVADITMSLDGFVTGPGDGPGRGLGQGGEALHNWVMGGPWSYDAPPPFAPVDVDRQVLEEAIATSGATIIGRRMFDAVDGWGGNPPGGPDAPHFVLTHSAPERWTAVESPFTFVTDGVHSALAQARDVAGERDVVLGGGANVIQQFMAAGLVDELRLHVAPLLLVAGKRLFDNLGDRTVALERTRVVQSPHATHIYLTVRH